VIGLFKRLFSDQEGEGVKAVFTHADGQGLDLKAAIAAHRNWKLKLDDVLAGRSDEDLKAEHICFDDRCDLGKWIHGPAKAKLNALVGFQKLVSDHRTFHHAASNVVALAKAGKADQALTILTGPYDTASRNVIAALEEIESIVSSPRTAKLRAADFPSFKRQIVRSFSDITGPMGDGMALRMEKTTDAGALTSLLPAAAEFVASIRGNSAGNEFRKRFATLLPA